MDQTDSQITSSSPPAAAAPPDKPAPTASGTSLRPHWHFLDWFWFILKNVLGWVMMLTALVLGPAPGPGGVPLFVIGFALITFPGKRRLTARVLRGIPVDRQNRRYQLLVATVAILLPGMLLYMAFGSFWWKFFDEQSAHSILLGVLYFSGAVLIFVFGLRGVHIINAGLKGVAVARRHVRPYLRKKGLDLLPPRRRARLRRADGGIQPDDEILEIHERHLKRLRSGANFLKAWFWRLLRIALVVAVFGWMLRPVVTRWSEVKGPILGMNWWYFAAAAAMFTIFLFVFRVQSWRRIMSGFGHRLPGAAATRIWSMSELARYIPGVIWQVVGRVYLTRPYGVSGSISSASQVLELTIFMLANILVAVGCLAMAGMRQIPVGHRQWLLIAVAFVPFLLALLHPRVFYGLLNALMRRLGKPPVEQALRKRQIAWLVLFNVLGLLWQGLAVWVLTHGALGLPLVKWYVLAGAYCLAWTIGFSVGFMFPGGMGMREAVFITTLQFVLPRHAIAASLSDPNLLRAFLGFIGVLLRIWAITGELLMAGLALAADYRGAVGDPRAPGRVTAAAVSAAGGQSQST